MGEMRGHALHDRRYRGDVCRLAAGHDGERTLARGERTARHRRIDPAHGAAPPQPPGDVESRVRVDRRMVDDDLAGRLRGRQTVLAEAAILDRRRVEDAHQDEIARRRHRSGRRRAPRTCRHDSRIAVRREVPHRHGKTLIEQAKHHSFAHDADPDEAELRLLRHRAVSPPCHSRQEIARPIRRAS